MKYVAIFLIVFLIYFVNLSLQTPQFNNCSDDIAKDLQDGCVAYTCDEEYISVLGCPDYRCSGRQLGYQDEDASEPYPACCGKPICQ